MTTYAPGWYPPSFYEPRPNYVYRVHGARKRLLYIGVSDQPDRRFWMGHRLRACWFMDIAAITITGYPCRVAAEVAELAAIWDECPLWNHAGQWDRESWLAPERRRAAQAAARRNVSERDMAAQWDKVWVMIAREMSAACPEGFDRSNPSESWRVQDAAERKRRRQRLAAKAGTP